MVHAVEKMAYAGKTPWHGLGTKVSPDLTPQEMAKAAGLDWEVEKRPLFFQLDGGQMFEIGSEYALIRKSDQSLLSVVGSKYKPVQNHEALEFFTQYCEAGQMKMETAGSLWGGRYIWALAALGQDFKLAGGDQVRGYLLLANPHVFGKALLMQFTAVRVVCWNTLTAAVGRSFSGKGDKIFRMPHSLIFDHNAKQEAAQTLGILTKQMKEFEEISHVLSRRKATDEAVKEYFGDVMQLKDPKKKKKDADGNEKPSAAGARLASQFQAALTYAPGFEMPSSLGTWWGALNAVTYICDHEVGRERDTALKNAWFGEKANIKQRALDLAMEYAEKAPTNEIAPPAPAVTPRTKKTKVEVPPPSDDQPAPPVKPKRSHKKKESV